MKHLTPNMIALLKAMQEGRERVHYMPCRGRFNPTAYYFCFGLPGNTNRCTAAAKALLDRGLATKKITNQWSGEHDLILTEAGRAYQCSAAQEGK